HFALGALPGDLHLARARRRPVRVCRVDPLHLGSPCARSTSFDPFLFDAGGALRVPSAERRSPAAARTSGDGVRGGPAPLLIVPMARARAYGSPLATPSVRNSARPSAPCLP